MPVILDVAMFSEPALVDASQVFAKHRGTWEHFSFMANKVQVHVVKFCGFHQDEEHDGVRFYFRIANDSLSRLNELCRILREITPDLIITHSFRFPIQTWLLKQCLHPKQIMLLQHHSDRLHASGAVRLLQRMAFGRVNAFTFMSADMAATFRDAGIMRTQPVFEIMEGSTNFVMEPRMTYRQNAATFLWVGRLIDKKDPFTVLQAFKTLKQNGTAFHLKFICRDGPAKSAFLNSIRENGLEKDAEILWNIPYDQLAVHYKEADYLVCSSQDEGSAWAVSESMACGCVPLMSNHPARQCMVGDAGLYYECGNAKALADLLINLDAEDFLNRSKKARQRFEEKLSFEAIARDTLSVLSLAASVPE